MAAVALCVGDGECAFVRTLSPRWTRRVRFHENWLGVIIARREKMPEGSPTAPDGLCSRPKGTGGSELLDESDVSSDFNGYAVRLI